MWGYKKAGNWKPNNMYLEQEYEKTFVSLSTPKGALDLPESKPDQWDYAKNRWTARNSSLSTYNWLVFLLFCKLL